MYYSRSLDYALVFCSFTQEVSINEADRHFCFRVTSPVRILLLQAESTKGMVEWYHLVLVVNADSFLDMSLWIEALNMAITSSFHKEDNATSPSATTPEKKFVC